MDIEVKKENGYYSLYVNGRLQIREESFAVCDGVKCRLLGIDCGHYGELQDIADSILESVKASGVRGR